MRAIVFDQFGDESGCDAQEFQIIVKGGIIHLVPEQSLEDLRGFARGISTEGLRDKSDRL